MQGFFGKNFLKNDFRKIWKGPSYSQFGEQPHYKKKRCLIFQVLLLQVLKSLYGFSFIAY